MSDLPSDPQGVSSEAGNRAEPEESDEQPRGQPFFLQELFAVGLIGPLVGGVTGALLGYLVAKHPQAPPGVVFWVWAGAVGGTIGTALNSWVVALFGSDATDGELDSMTVPLFVAALVGGALGGIVGGALDGTTNELVFGALWGIGFGLMVSFALAFLLGIARKVVRTIPASSSLLGLAGGAAAAAAVGINFPVGDNELFPPILRMAAGGIGGLVGGLAAGFLRRRLVVPAAEPKPKPARRLPFGVAALVTIAGTAYLLSQSSLSSRIGQRGRAKAAELSPDGTQLLVTRSATGAAKGPDVENTKLLNVPTGDLVRQLGDCNDALRFMPGGTHAVGRGILWSLDDGSLLQSMPRETVETIGTGFSGGLQHGKRDLRVGDMVPLAAKGRVLAELIFDGTTDDTFLAIWDVEANINFGRVHVHDGLLTALSVSPNVKYVLTADDDKNLKLWELDAESPMLPLSPQPLQTMTVAGQNVDNVSTAAISPDGRWAVGAVDGIGNRDYSVIVWDMQAGQEVRRFQGHVERVTVVARLPDGRRIVTGSEDRTVRVWDFESGQELKRLHVRRPVHSLSLSDDGSRMLVATGIGALRLFELE